ncbi:MAG: hypothetical protein M1836_001293 [Candelina mexicana]|nr:MAG: hypothetical protein M1836_001293 [Candelina mexicana]
MIDLPTACRGATRSGNCGPVWITDLVLANAFDRFLKTSCQSRKRWGSSVPGPLEARRRSAKRRMMNVAVAGGHSLMDVGTMLGYGGAQDHGCWRWEAPTRPPSTDSKTVQPALPACLDQDRNLSCDTVPLKLGIAQRRLNTGLGTIVADNSRQSLLENRRVLKDRLRSVSDADEIRHVFMDLKINIRRTPLYSSFMLKTLLSRQVKKDAVANYLTDPALNTSEVWNLERVILHYAQKGPDDESWRGLMQTIKKTLAHGTVSDYEIRSILRGVPDVVVKFRTDVSNHADQCLSFYQTIWEAIQSSHVSSPQDLDARTLDLMLFQLSRIPSSAQNYLMAIDIIKSASPSQLHHMTEGISSYLVGWAHGWRDMEMVVQDHSADFVCIPYMPKFIHVLPLSVARSTIPVALRRILASKKSGTHPEPQSKTLHPWIATIALAERQRKQLLTNTDWQAVELKLNMRNNKRRIAQYLSNFDAKGKSGFFFRHWVPRVLDRTARSKESTYSLKQRRFQELCEGSPIDDSYCNIILAHYQLDLPYHRILKKLLAFLSNFCTKSAKLRTLTLLTRFRVIRAKPKGKNAIPDIRGWGSFMLLRFSKADPYLYFDHDTDLASPLSASDAELAGRVLQFLRPLPSPVSPASNVYDQDLAIAAMPKIDFIHKLALFFAHSAHVSARLAFRHVYRCYAYLKHRQATLKPELSRALVHAGIIRYLWAEQWVSTTKLRWVLGLVRALEGDEVADQIDEVVYQWRGRNLLLQTRKRRRDWG